jgi:hypothetical protein
MGTFSSFIAGCVFLSRCAMLRAKNGENKKEWKEMKCVSHVNETLIRIAMIYERLREAADDYCLCYISDYTTNNNDDDDELFSPSHVSQL